MVMGLNFTSEHDVANFDHGDILGIRSSSSLVQLAGNSGTGDFNLNQSFLGRFSLARFSLIFDKEKSFSE